MGLTVAGTGYLSCDHVYVFIDGTRIGSAAPDDAGVVDLRGLSVPGGLSPGDHSITSSCDPSGSPLVGSTPFEVTGRRWHRSEWVTSLPRLNQVSWELGSVGTSALATVVLMVLVGFPSHLFNRTLEEHYDEIRGWFGLQASPSEPTRAGRLGLSAVFFFAGAVIYSLLDPGFGLDASSFVTFVGRLVSLVVGLLVFSVPSLLYMRRRFSEPGTLRVRPGTLALAGLFVATSRVLRLSPGYVYGLLAGFAFQNNVSPAARGRLAAAKLAFLLTVGLAAWLAWSAVATIAATATPSIPILVVESVLASLFAGGLLTAAFTLLPLQLFDGSHVLTWSRLAWMAQFGVSAFLVIHILLKPSSGYVSDSGTSSMTAAAIAFAAFAALSIAFWAYFRYRPARTASANADAQAHPSPGTGAE